MHRDDEPQERYIMKMHVCQLFAEKLLNFHTNWFTIVTPIKAQEQHSRVGVHDTLYALESLSLSLCVVVSSSLCLTRGSH